jgi:hypothetical protein
MNEFIPMLKIVVVFLFPFIGVFFILMSGKPFLYWFTALCFVSLWRPTEAIIHATVNHFLIDELQRFNVLHGITFKSHLSMNAALLDYVGPAAMLAMTVPGIAAMILGWIAPKAAMGVVSALMLGSHRLATTAQSSADQAQMETMKRAKEEEDIKMQQMWEEASQQFQHWRNSLNQRHNQMTGPFGQASAEQPFASAGIRRGAHLSSQSLSYNAGQVKQDAAQFLQSVSGSFAQRLGRNLDYAVATQEGQQAVSNLVKEAMDNGTFAEAVKGNKLLKFGYEQAKAHSENFSQMSNKEKADAAAFHASLVAKAGLKEPGILDFFTGLKYGAEGGVKLDYKHTWSGKEAEEIRKAYGSTDKFVQAMQKGLSKDYVADFRKGVGLKDGQSYQDNASVQRQVRNATHKVTDFAKQYQEAKTATQSVIASKNVSDAYSVKMDDIFASTRRSDMFYIKSVLEKTGRFQKVLAGLDNGASEMKLQSDFQFDFNHLGDAQKVEVLKGMLDMPGLGDNVRGNVERAIDVYKMKAAEAELNDIGFDEYKKGIAGDVQAHGTTIQQIDSKQQEINKKLHDNVDRVQSKANTQLQQTKKDVGDAKGLRQRNAKVAPGSQNDLAKAEKEISGKIDVAATTTGTIATSGSASKPASADTQPASSHSHKPQQQKVESVDKSAESQHKDVQTEILDNIGKAFAKSGYTDPVIKVMGKAKDILAATDNAVGDVVGKIDGKEKEILEHARMPEEAQKYFNQARSGQLKTEARAEVMQAQSGSQPKSVSTPGQTVKPDNVQGNESAGQDGQQAKNTPLNTDMTKAAHVQPTVQPSQSGGLQPVQSQPEPVNPYTEWKQIRSGGSGGSGPENRDIDVYGPGTEEMGDTMPDEAKPDANEEKTAMKDIW